MKAFARSSHTTSRSCFSDLALWMASQIIVACSMHPKTPGMPPFWTDVFMYPFSVRHFVKRCAIQQRRIIIPFCIQKRDWSKLVYFSQVLLLRDINSLSRNPLLTDLPVAPCSSYYLCNLRTCGHFLVSR